MRQSLAVVALAVLVGLLGGGQAFAQAAQAPAAWSATDCQACHDKAVSPPFQKTNHAKLGDSCASCHPNVAEHAKAQMAGEKGPVPSLKGLKATVEGVISVAMLSVEDQIAQGTEMAKEMKTKFDPKSVKGPKLSITIKGEGAEVQ